jgi:CubicO group peptidase (beta-lactamase class C family)
MHPALRSTPVRAALLVGAAVIFIINSIPSTGGTTTPADDHAIEAYVDAQVADGGYPGASLAIIRGGHVTDLHSIGTADASGRPVGTETPFVIGSLSKSLTALAVLRLVDAGRVELDAPVTRYLPAFRTSATGATPITVRQLLDQTSGLPGSATGLSTPVSTLAGQIASLATVEPGSAPGTRYAYANANYVVLGGVIEAASGRSYADAMRSLVFGPLGMTHTTADPAAASALGLGDSHRIWFGIPTVHAPLLRPDLVPAGFIVSTAADVARPIEMLLAGGRIGDRAFLSRVGVAALTTGGPSTGVGDARYGMGWVVGSHNGHATVSHDGSTTDMAAFQGFDPSSGDGIVVLANAQAIPYELLGKIDMIAFGALDLMLGREPNGTLEKFYPLVDVALIVALVVMLRGHLQLVHRVRGRRGSTAGGRFRRLAGITFHGYLDLLVPLVLLLRAPDAFAAPWPVLLRTDIGLVLAVFIAVRLTGGALRLAGWWRTGRRPVWTVVGGEVPPVAAAG